MLSHQFEYISYFSPFSIFWNHNRAFVLIDVSEMTKVVDIGKQISIMKIHYQAMDLQIQTLPDYKSIMYVLKGLNLSKVNNCGETKTFSSGVFSHLIEIITFLNA